MTHKASSKFWKRYQSLPEAIRKQADKAYSLLKGDPRHPSLQLKKLASTPYWSVRINDGYRALAVQKDEVLVWFWIDPHAEYDRLIA